MQKRGPSFDREVSATPTPQVESITVRIAARGSIWEIASESAMVARDSVACTSGSATCLNMLRAMLIPRPPFPLTMDRLRLEVPSGQLQVFVHQGFQKAHAGQP